MNEKFRRISARVFGRGDSLLRPALAGLVIGGALFLVLTNWDGVASAGTTMLSALTKSEAPKWSYRDCDAARAAGAAPVHAYQPGYGAHLDRDGDGVGCEPYYR